MSNEVKNKVDMDPKYIIKLTVTLFLTCMVVAGVLGWVNSIPSHLFKALPFLITAIVLVVTSIRKREGSGQPAALGLNYFREER